MGGRCMPHHWGQRFPKEGGEIRCLDCNQLHPMFDAQRKLNALQGKYQRQRAKTSRQGALLMTLAASAHNLLQAMYMCDEFDTSAVEKALSHVPVVNGTPYNSPADLLEALESLRAAMAFQCRDMSLDHRDSWAYGVLLGWKDALPEQAALHNWDEATVARLRRYHAALPKPLNKPIRNQVPPTP